MIKTITLGTHPIEVNSSLGWAYFYKEQFGHDILPDLMPLMEAAVGGLGEILNTLKDEDGMKDEITIKEVKKLMDSDSVVNMAIGLAGMEFTTLTNILWAMAKNQKESIPEPRKFINQFDCLPVNELALALVYLIIEASNSVKNLESLLPKIEAMIPSVLTPSPSQESTEG